VILKNSSCIRLASNDSPLSTGKLLGTVSRGHRGRIKPHPTIQGIPRDEEAGCRPCRPSALAQCHPVCEDRELPSGKRVVGALLFPRDRFGLAENGRYINTAQTITRVVLYRLPNTDLRVLLMHDAGRQFQFLSKVTHELRQAQRRMVLLNRRDAAGRLAMFIEGMSGKPALETLHEDVVLPMTRSDIAAFLGLSLESVSRASAELERRRMVKFSGRHIVRIVDPPRFSKLVAAV
jgi:CRP-like cAMP-binding protein